MARCSALVKAGTPNEHPCGCRASYRATYFMNAPEYRGIVIFSGRESVTLCGIHLMRETPNHEDGLYFITKYPIGNPNAGEVFHQMRGKHALLPQYHLELSQRWGSLIYNSDEWNEKRRLVERMSTRHYLEVARPVPAPLANPFEVVDGVMARPANLGGPILVRRPAIPFNGAIGPPAPAPAPVMSIANQEQMSNMAKNERIVAPEEEAPPPPPPPPPPTYMPDPNPPMLEGDTRVCAVCMTDVGTVVCSEKRHVMCEKCFEEYAVIESGDAAFDGELRCCGSKPYGCKANAFSQLTIIRALSENKAHQFLENCGRSKERLVIEEYKSTELERVRRENACSDVERARNYIADNILTIRCPNERCGAAILDFTGCLALICARCSAGICAKCFEHCGKDAHPHIRNGECKIDADKSYFASQDYINNVQMVYKTRKLNEYMKTLPPRVSSEVLAKYRVEIKEGGVNI